MTYINLNRALILNVLLVDVKYEGFDRDFFNEILFQFCRRSFEDILIVQLIDFCKCLLHEILESRMNVAVTERGSPHDNLRYSSSMGIAHY